jgi:hypothetical protein
MRRSTSFAPSARHNFSRTGHDLPQRHLRATRSLDSRESQNPWTSTRPKCSGWRPRSTSGAVEPWRRTSGRWPRSRARWSGRWRSRSARRTAGRSRRWASVSGRTRPRRWPTPMPRSCCWRPAWAPASRPESCRPGLPAAFRLRPRKFPPAAPASGRRRARAQSVPCTRLNTPDVPHPADYTLVQGMQGDYWWCPPAGTAGGEGGGSSGDDGGITVPSGTTLPPPPPAYCEPCPVGVPPGGALPAAQGACTRPDDTPAQAVYSVPWLYHPDQGASVFSECGRKALAESFASQYPVDRLIAAFQPGADYDDVIEDTTGQTVLGLLR